METVKDAVKSGLSIGVWFCAVAMAGVCIWFCTL